jgi:hypothetical protein
VRTDRRQLKTCKLLIHPGSAPYGWPPAPFLPGILHGTRSPPNGRKMGSQEMKESYSVYV